MPFLRPTPRGSDFYTAFPATENPISEGGIWQLGGTDGLDWRNPRTTSGKAYATAFNATYDDSLAHLKTSYRTFAANQYAQATCYVSPGYSPGGGADHECELLLRFTITAHSATGYEVINGSDGGFALVRWNGGQGDYTTLDFTTDPPFDVPMADSDVVYAQMVGNLITVKKNGVTVFGNIDAASFGTVYNTGQPGLGFYCVDNGGGTVLANFAWKAFQAGNL